MLPICTRAPEAESFLHGYLAVHKKNLMRVVGVVCVDGEVVHSLQAGSWCLFFGALYLHSIIKGFSSDR